MIVHPISLNGFSITCFERNFKFLNRLLRSTYTLPAFWSWYCPYFTLPSSASMQLFSAWYIVNYWAFITSHYPWYFPLVTDWSHPSLHDILPFIASCCRFSSMLVISRNILSDSCLLTAISLYHHHPSHSCFSLPLVHGHWIRHRSFSYHQLFLCSTHGNYPLHHQHHPS